MPPSWGVAVAVGEMYVFQARSGLVNRSGDGRLLDVHVKGIEHQPDVGKVHRLEKRDCLLNRMEEVGLVPVAGFEHQRQAARLRRAPDLAHAGQQMGHSLGVPKTV